MRTGNKNENMNKVKISMKQELETRTETMNKVKISMKKA